MKSNASSPAETTNAIGLACHRGYRRIFREGRLTLGFIMPLEAYPNGPLPSLEDHVERARQVDVAGFAGLWLRDVPFLDPSFGDAGQILDPFTYAGFLAGVTKDVSVGTAGIVLPLREPLIVAKQAASADQLLGGRFLLGLSSGDRPEEYPAFGVEFSNRAERYRDALEIATIAMKMRFPRHVSQYYGVLNGAIDLIPKPVAQMPIVAIGRAGQSYEWLAANVDAWIWHGPDVLRLSAIVPRWRMLTAGGPFKPYGYGTMFDLDGDPDAPLVPGRHLRIGRKALVELLKRHEGEGVSHVMLNMKPSQRRAKEVIAELAEYVLPLFPSG